MANITQVHIGSTTYNIKDAEARNMITKDVNKALESRNLFSPEISQLTGAENDLYKYDELDWVQGTWTSSGNQSSDYWIRTGLIDGGFIIHNKNLDYGYIVGKFRSNGTFVEYPWMSSLISDEYYFIPDVGSDYKVRFRQRHMTNSTQVLTPDEATVEIFRVSGILKNTLRYVDNVTVESYGTSLTEVAGHGNIVFTIRASYWNDEPFNGVGINMQYATNYDIQFAYPLDGTDFAFRIVNRNTKEVFLNWQTLSGKLADFLQYDNISDSSTYNRVFANVAGVKNLVSNIAFSAWEDVPFGGAGINMQYTANWDLQAIFALDHKEIAYRFVNRSDTHAVYGTGWYLVNGNSLCGKKVSIIGDSRSSYTGTVPEGNAAYYPRGRGAVLTSVSQMWWRRVIDHFGMELVVNDSYSGGYVSDPNISGTPAAKILSSDTAVNNLGSTAPDIILVYAGVNDWNGNAVQIGTYDGSQTFPSTNTTFREALALLISKVQTKFPEADIWLCTNPYCCPQGTGYNISEMPVPKIKNSGITLNAFNDAIREMAHLFGCGIIDFERCGVNWGNLASYSGDMGTTNGLHYNAAGHELLANVAISTLAKNY